MEDTKMETKLAQYIALYISKELERDCDIGAQTILDAVQAYADAINDYERSVERG
jgi:hypothetical protein